MTDKKENEQLISIIHTSCKNCIFAEFLNKKQSGCKLDRLKYHSDIIEVYDDDLDFFVVNNGFCLYYRTKELMDFLKIPEEKWQETTIDQVKYRCM